MENGDAIFLVRFIGSENLRRLAELQSRDALQFFSYECLDLIPRIKARCQQVKSLDFSWEVDERFCQFGVDDRVASDNRRGIGG